MRLREPSAKVHPAFLCLWILIGLAGCSTIGVRPQVAVLEAPVASMLCLDSRQVVVIDLRPRAAYNEAHIPRAISSPLEDLDASIDRLGSAIAKLALLDNPTLLVYDQDEDRSIEGADRLFKSGFENVVRIRGGIGKWIEGGHPTVTSGRPEKPKRDQ